MNNRIIPPPDKYAPLQISLIGFAVICNAASILFLMLDDFTSLIRFDNDVPTLILFFILYFVIVISCVALMYVAVKFINLKPWARATLEFIFWIVAALSVCSYIIVQIYYGPSLGSAFEYISGTAFLLLPVLTLRSAHIKEAFGIALRPESYEPTIIARRSTWLFFLIAVYFIFSALPYLKIVFDCINAGVYKSIIVRLVLFGTAGIIALIASIGFLMGRDWGRIMLQVVALFVVIYHLSAITRPDHLVPLYVVQTVLSVFITILRSLFVISLLRSWEIRRIFVKS